jgi:crotonobetainyl-CoA:carnitine CoA-transferase CaiB-like acyl-CoA transferase
MSRSHPPMLDFPHHADRDAAAGDPPIHGIRVVDFTHFIAGPFATMVLGDFGADVIKIESPAGDVFRLYPPADPNIDAGGPFLWSNRNKRGIAIDLKQPEGLAIARALAAQADVVMENFSTGVMERLGLGYDSLAADNPGLIYCSVSAYGRTGPYSDRLGFDQVVQAESGFLSMNGFPDREGVRAQPVVMDTATALMASNAVLAALVARGRTGKGQRIDVSLYDTALTMVGFASMQYLQCGKEPSRTGNTSNDTSPTGVFKASDASFYLSTTTTPIYRKLMTAIGRPDLAEDPELQDVAGRIRHRERLIGILVEVFAQREWAHWEKIFRATGVPTGEVRNLSDALYADVTRASGLVTRIAHSTAGTVPNIALPTRFSDTPVVDPIPAPLIGQHTEEVLRDILQLGAEEIDRLFDAGIVKGTRAEATERARIREAVREAIRQGAFLPGA